MTARKQKRGGRTVNRSVSFTSETLRLLEQRAERHHGGNLSAAIAEAARLFCMQEARQAVVEAYEREFGPLTAAQIAEVRAEERGQASPRRTKRVA